MELLPAELLYEISLNLPIISVLNLCQTSRAFQTICLDDEHFWKERITQDFGYQTKLETLTWQQLYMNLSRHQIKSFPLIDDDTNQSLGLIWVQPNTTVRMVLDNIFRLYPQQPRQLITFMAPDMIFFYLIYPFEINWLDLAIDRFPYPNYSLWTQVTSIRVTKDNDKIKQITEIRCRRCGVPRSSLIQDPAILSLNTYICLVCGSITQY